MKKRLSPTALKRLQDEVEACRAMGDGLLAAALELLLKWYMDEVRQSALEARNPRNPRERREQGT